MRSGCCLFLPSISDYSLTLPNLYFPPFYSICPSAFPGLSKLHKSPPFTSFPPLLSLKCSPSLPSLRVLPPSNYYDTILLSPLYQTAIFNPDDDLRVAKFSGRFSPYIISQHHVTRLSHDETSLSRDETSLSRDEAS